MSGTRQADILEVGFVTVADGVVLVVVVVIMTRHDER